MVAPEQSHLFKITTTLALHCTGCGFTQVVWLSSQVVNCCPPATSRLLEVLGALPQHKQAYHLRAMEAPPSNSGPESLHMSPVWSR